MFQEVNALLIILRYLLSPSLQTSDDTLDHVAEIVSARLLHLSPLSMLYSSEGSHYVWPPPREQGLMLLEDRVST